MFGSLKHSINIRKCNNFGYMRAALPHRSLELLAAAERRGWEVVRRYSMARAKRGEFEVVLVDDLGRLGGDLRVVLKRLDALTRIGVRVIATRDPGLDTGRPGATDALAVLSDFANRGKGRPRKVEVDLREARRLIADGASINEAAREQGVSPGALWYRLKVDV